MGPPPPAGVLPRGCDPWPSSAVTAKGGWNLCPRRAWAPRQALARAQASPPTPQSLWPSLNFSQALDGPALGPDTSWPLFVFFLWSCLSVKAR